MQPPPPLHTIHVRCRTANELNHCSTCRLLVQKHSFTASCSHAYLVIMIRGRSDLRSSKRVVIKAGTSIVSTPEGYPSLSRIASIVEQVRPIAPYKPIIPNIVIAANRPLHRAHAPPSRPGCFPQTGGQRRPRCHIWSRRRWQTGKQKKCTKIPRSLLILLYPAPPSSSPFTSEHVRHAVPAL